MPFIPFPSFDPIAPAGYPLPVLWLRRHARRWAFPAYASRSDIDRYRIWLHVLRTDARLVARERELRPPLEFRLLVWFHRAEFLLLFRMHARFVLLRYVRRSARNAQNRERK